MAIKCRVFMHSTKDLASNDGDATGKLADDVENYITANIGTLDATTSLNVTSSTIGGGHVMTLVVLDNT